MSGLRAGAKEHVHRVIKLRHTEGGVIPAISIIVA
jgi:hypothetical protein